MVLFGSSWPLLGRFGPKMAPKMGAQIAPNRFKMGYDGELGAQESLIGHGSAYGLQNLAEDEFFENLPVRKVYKNI